MSSYYTAAQLEAVRKENLRQELRSSIQALTAQIRTEPESRVQTMDMAPAAAADQDTGLNGYQFQGTRAKTVEVSVERRAALDFSDLLRLPSRDLWAERFQALRDRVPERAVLSKQDQLDRARLLEDLDRLAVDRTRAPEARLEAAEQRVEAYLAVGTPTSQVDPAWLESVALEYRAVCTLAGVTPSETLPAPMEEETRRLTRRLERQKEDAYLMRTLTGIMEDLGCHVREEAALGPASGQLFSVEGFPLCDVFVGEDQSGFLFEPIASGKQVSLEQKRQIQAGAAHICTLCIRS